MDRIVSFKKGINHFVYNIRFDLYLFCISIVFILAVKKKSML